MVRPLRCVLLIDDDPDDNFLHELVLRESNLCDEVRVLENGPDALRYLTQPNRPDYLLPDAILLDVNMPGMNGLEFLADYHRLPSTLKSRVVVIMLTTALNSSDEQWINRLPEPTGYQPKPLTQPMLQQLVRQHFD